MHVEITVTEDTPVWGTDSCPPPAGVLRQVAAGIWAAEFPDGSVEVLALRGPS